MKTIAILSPETVPLPLKENSPLTIKEGDKEFSLLDKCTRTTAPGKRSWRFAEYLSKHDDFEVVLFIPDLNLPPHNLIDKSNLNFEIKSYSFKASNWDWSSELDRKLKKFDFVIIQSTTGNGFQNCAVLPKTTQVILDAWVPLSFELPCVLLTYSRIRRKVFWVKKFINQYQDLLRRSNCVLYANNRQQYLYEGQFTMIQKLDWSSYKFSPLLKVPFGVDKVKRVECEYDDPDKLKLLWYGPVYPWYSPELLLDALAGRDDIHIDFVGIVHPRYKRVYTSYFKKFFDEVKEAKNITIIEEYCDDSSALFPKYDAGIVIARNWLEETYSHRSRILEMSASGFPVIINEGNALYEELDFLRPTLHPVSTTNLLQDLLKIKENKDKLKITDQTLDNIYNILNWESVLSPLVDYVKRF